jgi:hypothetical protein
MLVPAQTAPQEGVATGYPSCVKQHWRRRHLHLVTAAIGTRQIRLGRASLSPQCP